MTPATDYNTELSPVTAMSDGEFEKLREIVLAVSGITLSPSKKTMLTVRLLKRIKALGMKSFTEYVRFVSGPSGRVNEIPDMIDAVSTNKTEFFREAEHFNYLVKAVIPELLGVPGRRRHEGLNIWSAGCSSGEEPYTLAMVLSDYRESYPGLKFSIHATDISGRILEKAKQAVYPACSLEKVPPPTRRKYLMKGKGRFEGNFRVVPELRRAVSFQRHNLAEQEFEFGKPMDLIFCRNVIIYLERNVQKRLFENFHTALSPGGYLFVGHSETLDGISRSFKRVAPTIYRRS